MTLIPEIKPEQSIELLKALHILTRDGKLNQDSRRKLKQVYHLYQFIEPLLQNLLQKRDDLILVDHGAGKSYLGFILYDLFLKSRNAGKVIGIEGRPELVIQSEHLAAALGFDRMRFMGITVEESMHHPEIPPQVDIVTALHACNTATDDAIRFGLDRNAEYLVLVPCCQAEVAEVLRRQKQHMLQKTVLTEIWRHPLHSREFGSHITNVLRCLQLEAAGYQVTVTELVGWEHSMKNELIIARKHTLNNPSARARMERILDMLGLEELHPRFLSMA